MPRFVVRFDLPVVYQPNHPRRALSTTALEVIAETSVQAMQHAIRTTVGEGQVIGVEEVVDAA